MNLYFQICNKKYLKVILTTVFDKIFIYYFSLKINMFINNYKNIKAG